MLIKQDALNVLLVIFQTVLDHANFVQQVNILLLLAQLIVQIVVVVNRQMSIQQDVICALQDNFLTLDLANHALQLNTHRLQELAAVIIVDLAFNLSIKPLVNLVLRELLLVIMDCALIVPQDPLLLVREQQLVSHVDAVKKPLQMELLVYFVNQGTSLL